MTKFNVGDVVKVVESPFTTERLEDNPNPLCEYLGKKFLVEEYEGIRPLLDDIEILIWWDDWLELVEDSENGEGV